MKKIFNIIGVSLIIAVAIYFKIYGVHNPLSKNIVHVDGKPYEVLKHTIDTEYVAKWKTVTKKGEDIIHDTTIYVPIPINVDTLAILNDYFAKKVFKDTLRLDDSLGFVAVQDTLSKNAIFSRKYTAKVNKTTIKETMIVKELPKSHIYYGLNMSLDKPNFVHSLGGSLMFQSKCDRIYTLGAGIDTKLTPYLSTSIYWKLK